jgi:hypothetical protein
MDPKVFVIGLSRTGTTSMMSALTTLGYRCLHYPDTDDVVAKTLAGRFDWDVLEQYDAFGDTPVAAYYDDLDEQCPNSKFILTVRDETEWLRSCSNKIKNKMAPYNPPNKKVLFSRIIRAQLYGRPYYRRFHFQKAYHRHTEDVVDYFSDRPDSLCVMNVTEGWAPLCAFLGHPEPDMKFPHIAKATDGNTFK